MKYQSSPCIIQPFLTETFKDQCVHPIHSQGKRVVSTKNEQTKGEMEKMSWINDELVLILMGKRLNQLSDLIRNNK